MTSRLLPGVLLAGLCAGLLAGCPDNPYKASTWTKKLDDPRQEEQAVTELEHLGDPSAIPALGEAWESQGKPIRLLQVMISLARPLTPQEADKTNMTDYVKTGRPASWDKALPYLTKAIDEVDEANPRSTEGAQKAADALGEAQQGLDSLIGIAQKPTSKKLVEAQISAIRAIGDFQGEKAKAVAALLKLIDREPPPDPATAKDRDTARGLQEKYALYLGVTGAAINSIGNLRAPSATNTLVLAMYRNTPLFTQVRRALVASGPSAEDELRKILRGENADVNQLFKDKHLDRYCGDQGNLPPDQCVPTSLKIYYPAVVLGDFYDPASVKDLLGALKDPTASAPAAFQGDQPALGTGYEAIFMSLRKIGAAEGADVVRSMWDVKEAKPAKPKRGRKGQPAQPAPDQTAMIQTRVLAIGTYPFVTRDNAGVDDLGKIAADNDADPSLRQEAAAAYARLSRDTSSIKVFNDLANKYFDASAKKRKEADGKPKADAAAADKIYDAAKKVVIDAKANLARIAADKSKTADDIHAASDAVKKAEDALKDARKKHDTATLPFRVADRAAKDYKKYARMFQTMIARTEVAIRCKNDTSCYAATLKETPDDAAKNCARYISDIKDWTKDEKMGLLEGEVERAMLEIGKQGQKASNLTDALLDGAASKNGEDGTIRQSILLALPKIAKLPCNDCTQKLDAVLKAGEGQSTLAQLNIETTMLRNYFEWAGGRTPDAAPATAAGK